MPINPVQVHTNIDPTNAGRSSLEAWLQGSKDAADAARLGMEQEGEKQKEQRLQQAGLNLIDQLKNSSLVNKGGSASINPETGQVSVGGNPYARLGMAEGPKEARAFQAIVDKAYKPLGDQVTASRATLDYLNQGNSAADKLAMINEIKLGLGSARGVASIVGQLAGDKSIGSSTQSAINYLQNTPNVPTMTDAQRNAIRESVFARLPQMAQQQGQIQKGLVTQGATIAPNTDYNSLIQSTSGPMGENLGQLQKMQSDYMAATKNNKNQASQPSAAAQPQTTLDKLMSFFKKSPSANAQQATFDPDSYLKNNQATPAPQGSNQPPQGQ